MSLKNTHFGAEAIGRMLGSCRHLFFIGIGGINMSSLAILAAKRGFSVSGSDKTRTALTESLAAQGICVFYGHDRAHIAQSEAQAVIYTNAIGADNAEYVAATEKGLPCISRADFMGYLMRGFTHRVGVAGMHGKSTCTSMLAEIFTGSGEYDPTVLCGAQVRALGAAFRIGDARDHFIFEACEYMDSFLDFCPNVAVILNIEKEHMDYFSSLSQIRASFRAYADKTCEGGTPGIVIANGDDDNVTAALTGCQSEVIRFGFGSEADFTAQNLRAERGLNTFDIVFRGTFFCHVALRVPGRHNVYNALAAAAAAYVCGVSGETIGRALSCFAGARRRMEYKGKFAGADVYDDYGHHPTEIAATLEGVSGMGYRRVFCVFQPHTYSRLAALYDAFLSAFDRADRIIIAETYAAREVNVYPVSAETLARDLGERACYGATFAGITAMLREQVGDGDVIIIMGAGDIYGIFAQMGI